MKIQRQMAEYGMTPRPAKVASKVFGCCSRNPNVWRRNALSENQVLAGNMVNHPLTRYMFCSPGEGAVALVLARGARIRELARTPVHLRCLAFRTRPFGSFEVVNPHIAVESAPSATTATAAAAFEAPAGPEDVDVAQVQDAESGAEVVQLVEIGLCDREQEALIQRGATSRTGRRPVTTDGGCLANGKPIGASSVRQVHEVVLELRCDAGRPADPRSAPRRLHQGVQRTRCRACAILTV